MQAPRFKQTLKSRFKLCIRCISRRDRVQWRNVSSTREFCMNVTDIPEGFERQTRPSPLTEPWEPIYSKQTPDAIILGLRLAKPHTNARGFAHGGLHAAVTHQALGHSFRYKMRRAPSLCTPSM